MELDSWGIKSIAVYKEEEEVYKVWKGRFSL
jgi:hypothetical protein